jgi:hypothetical protein
VRNYGRAFKALALDNPGNADDDKKDKYSFSKPLFALTHPTSTSSAWHDLLGSFYQFQKLRRWRTQNHRSVSTSTESTAAFRKGMARTLTFAKRAQGLACGEECAGCIRFAF